MKCTFWHYDKLVTGKIVNFAFDNRNPRDVVAFVVYQGNVLVLHRHDLRSIDGVKRPG